MDFVPNTDYKIMQDKDVFSYGTDALLLTDFARPRGNVIDIGCGNGIMPLRIADNIRIKRIVGVEVQERVANLACANVELNGLTERIDIVNADIKDYARAHKDEFDCIITNPPYMKVNSGAMVDSDYFSIARHERMLTLKELMLAAKMLLKSHGDLFMIHRANRIVDIIFEMRLNGIEPKELQIIKNNAKSEPYMVLISGKKSAVEGLLYKPDILLCDYSARKIKSENL